MNINWSKCIVGILVGLSWLQTVPGHRKDKQGFMVVSVFLLFLPPCSLAPFANINWFTALQRQMSNHSWLTLDVWLLVFKEKFGWAIEEALKDPLKFLLSAETISIFIFLVIMQWRMLLQKTSNNAGLWIIRSWCTPLKKLWFQAWKRAHAPKQYFALLCKALK